MLMGALSSFSNVLNAVLLQSPYLACCAYVPAGQCLLNLMGLGQLVLQWAMFFAMYHN